MHPHQYNLTKAAYGVNETLVQLSIGRTTLYALIKEKKLNPVKIGKKTVFRRQSLLNSFRR